MVGMAAVFAASARAPITRVDALRTDRGLSDHPAADGRHRHNTMVSSLVDRESIYSVKLKSGGGPGSARTHLPGSHRRVAVGKVMTGFETVSADFPSRAGGSLQPDGGAKVSP